MKTPVVTFNRLAPLIVMSEAEQVEAVSLLRDAFRRIGHRPETFGDLVENTELRLRIASLLKRSGVGGVCN